MELRSQREIAARVMKCGKSRVWFDPARLGDISQAITTGDIRRLIADDVITSKQKKGVSKFRIEKIRRQKKKGRRKFAGSRKGKIGSRFSRKKTWINKIRAQRQLLTELRVNNKVEKDEYKMLYKKSSGGFFRSRSHMMSYIDKEMRKGGSFRREKR